MLLNAVLCVWNEEDIIESTVRHAFAQGCSNVFIIDNACTDNTVAIALRAGAKASAAFKTEHFDEDRKVAHLNATVQYINEITPDEQIWWLYIDADEFPGFDCEGTMQEVLKQLDSSIQAIHGHMFDHLPTHHPYHVQGYHPADFQPLCVKTSGSKIPLVRYDKGRPHAWSTGGAHDFITHGDIIPILKDFLQIHHFPYRNPEHTLKRTKILAETRNDWYKKFLKQVHAPNTSAYEERYNRLLKIYAQNKHLVLKTSSLKYDYANIIRWYDAHIHEYVPGRIKYEESLWVAAHYFFLEEYAVALCSFKDAYDVCEDERIQVWILIKIIECLARTDVDDARGMVAFLEKHADAEVQEYIDKNVTCLFDERRKRESPAKELIGKVELYQSAFPDGIEERYTKLAAEAAKNIFRG